MNKPIPLKHKFTLLVVIICLFPTLLNLFGVDFASAQVTIATQPNAQSFLMSMRGEVTHALMEWSAVIIAGLVALTSLIHYRLNRDITIPVIGLALLCAGITDAFHILAALQLITPSLADSNFIAFTWALSRVFNPIIMLVAGILVWGFAKRVLNNSGDERKGDKNLLIIIVITFLTFTFSLIFLATVIQPLPETLFPNALIRRPFDALPLGLFVGCGVLYWLLYIDKRSAIRYALFIGIIPQIVTQIHMVFGSMSLFDNHFNIAHFIKIIAYGTVWIGLMVDLIWVKSRVNENGQMHSHGLKVTLPEQGYQAAELEKSEKTVQKTKLLSFKLPLISFLLTMCISGAIGTGFYYESVYLIKEQRLEQLSNQAKSVERQLNLFANRVMAELEGLASFPDFIDGFVQYPSNETRSISDIKIIKDRVSLVSDHPLLIFSDSTQEGNKPVKVINSVSDNLLSDETLMHWLNNNISSFKDSESNNFVSVYRHEQNSYWVIATKIDRQGKVMSLVSVIEFEQSLDFFMGLEQGGNELLLANKQGDALIAIGPHLGREKIILNLDYPDLFALISDNKEVSTDFVTTLSDYTDNIGFYLPISFAGLNNSVPLHLFITQSNEKFDKYFEQVRGRMILVGLSIAIIVLALSILASQKLTRPLTLIVNAMRKYQSTGEVDQLPVKAKDETGELARNFSLMISQIEQRVQEQKQAISEANNVSARMQSILNSMVDAVINIDEHGKILAFNRSALSMFGYSEEEVLGKNIKLLMPSELAEKHDNYLARYKETGEQHILRISRQLPAMRKDGEVFPMILSVSEVQTDEGKIFTGLIRDITATQLLEKEREHVFHAAKELAWRLDFALSGPQIGVWDYDVETKALSWDKRMYRLYGSDIESGIEPKVLWNRSLHPDDVNVVEDALFKSINSGLDFKEVFRIILPNKSVNYIESYAKAFYDADGNITRIVGTNRDITDQQNLHELKQQALDMAEDSLKLKSEFLASMSHEIRTPMNGVLGMLGLLEQTPLDQRQEHYIKLASSSANSLLTVINDILDFSKIEAGKLEIEVLDFDLRSLLGEVVESLAIKAQEKGLELILNVNNVRGVMFKSDPTRIRQIVSNLVSNAIKFTDKGEIVVKASIEEDEHKNLMLLCSVTDSGIGIEKAKISALFDSFTQVDASTTREYGGTGLGLAIVKQLCVLMGGEVSVESELGKGSKFEFSIQISPSDSPKLLMPRVEIKGTHILIVDDNETNLEVLEGQLSQWGAITTKARSGAEALDIIEQNPHGYFKIAILDMQMPHMDGASLGKALKQSVYCQKTKLIMMTSMGTSGDAKYFANLGFSAYFPKPATTSDLFDAITVVLDDSEALASANPLVTHEHLMSIERRENTETKGNTVNILLVEDNRINQVVVQGMLESSGCNVDVAVNGKEALEKLEKAHLNAPYHAILMDCQMPIMDGYEATKAIRESQNELIDSNIPIIAMTANAMKGDREKCLESGMSDYIAKPVDSNLLLQKLNQWAKGFDIPKQERGKTNDKVEETIESKEVVDTGAELEEEVIWDDVGLLKRVRDNRVLAKKLIEMFLEDAPDLLKSILRSINKKEYQEAAATAHKIKGSVRNLGGVRLGSITHQVEQASKNENAETLQELVIVLEQAFSDFISALEHSDIRM